MFPLARLGDRGKGKEAKGGEGKGREGGRD